MVVHFQVISEVARVTLHPSRKRKYGSNASVKDENQKLVETAL